MTTTTDTLTWSNACSWADLCELTARWLLGEEPEHPTYGGAPEEETAAIRDELVALNRAGLLTSGSQPGETDQYGQQRAYLDAYAPMTPVDLAERIETRLLPTELIVEVYRSDALGSSQQIDGWLPVTLGTAGEVYTWGLGAPAGEDDFEFFTEAGVLSSIAAQLRRAPRISIVDPVWGRNDRLWPALMDALNITP